MHSTDGYFKFEFFYSSNPEEYDYSGLSNISLGLYLIRSLFNVRFTDELRFPCNAIISMLKSREKKTRSTGLKK